MPRKPLTSPIHENDIKGGRGQGSSCHSGNVFLRQMIKKYQPIYKATRYHRMKGIIAEAIYTNVKSLDPPGRFIEIPPYDTGKITKEWMEISKEGAMVKIKQALRDVSTKWDYDRSNSRNLDPEMLATLRSTIKTKADTQMLDKILLSLKENFNYVPEPLKSSKGKTNHGKHLKRTNGKLETAKPLSCKSDQDKHHGYTNATVGAHVAPGLSARTSTGNNMNISLHEEGSYESKARKLLTNINLLQRVPNFLSGMERKHTLSSNDPTQYNTSKGYDGYQTHVQVAGRIMVVTKPQHHPPLMDNGTGRKRLKVHQENNNQSIIDQALANQYAAVQSPSRNAAVSYPVPNQLNNRQIVDSDHMYYRHSGARHEIQGYKSPIHQQPFHGVSQNRVVSVNSRDHDSPSITQARRVSQPNGMLPVIQEYQLPLHNNSHTHDTSSKIQARRVSQQVGVIRGHEMNESCHNSPFMSGQNVQISNQSSPSSPSIPASQVPCSASFTCEESTMHLPLPHRLQRDHLRTTPGPRRISCANTALNKEKTGNHDHAITTPCVTTAGCYSVNIPNESCQASVPLCDEGIEERPNKNIEGAENRPTKEHAACEITLTASDESNPDPVTSCDVETAEQVSDGSYPDPAISCDLAITESPNNNNKEEEQSRSATGDADCVDMNAIKRSSSEDDIQMTKDLSDSNYSLELQSIPATDDAEYVETNAIQRSSLEDDNEDAKDDDDSYDNLLFGLNSKEEGDCNGNIDERILFYLSSMKAGTKTANA